MTRRKYWNLATPWGRFLAHADMMLMDHGVLRLFFSHSHALPGGMHRSNQPTPAELRALARKGIRTIVNLRGENEFATYDLEEEACRQAGLALVNFRIGSREVPRKETVRAAFDLFNTIEYPALAHCKSGADRAGIMSALYLIGHENRPVEEALKQLDWRFGHIRQAKTGVLDFFLETYLKETEKTPMAFMDWIEQAYEPERVARAFHDQWFYSILVDKILRHE